MPNDKMNELLRNRKIKNKQLASFRKQRIVKQYHKLEKTEEVAIQNQQQDDQGTRRKLEFYKQIFNESNPQPQPHPRKQKQQTPEPQQDPHEAKLEKLKNKKKKFIKKMQRERTKKGQPVMRNYVKYALTKLEETLEKEKGKKSK